MSIDVFRYLIKAWVFLLVLLNKQFNDNKVRLKSSGEKYKSDN